MQIIPRGPSFGEELGTGLGTLAGIKLAGLVKRHEQERERANFAQQWEPLIGKSTANFLSNLSPEERKSALGNLEALTGAFQQPGQENGLGAIARPMQPQFGQQQQMKEQQQLQQPEEQFNPQKAKLAERIFESPKDKAARERLEFQQRQANLKETKPYIDTLKSQEKAAKEGNLRLKRMENLIEKGNLPNAGLWSFLTKIEDAGPLATGGAGALLGSVVPGVGTALGAGIGGLVGALSGPFAGAAKSFIKSGNPDIEEFEKLSNDFVKNAKQYFGSRITDADLRVFMQTIPTLMQTDAGKKKVIENLRSLNELAEIEAKAARSIIKANGGIPPIDLEQQVKDKISNKIDKVAEEFIAR